MYLFLCYSVHRIEINRRTTRVGNFEVCVSTHVSLRMFIMQVLASQLPSLANRNAELAVAPLFWPVNCIKIGGHVTLLSGTTVYSLYCALCTTLLMRAAQFNARSACDASMFTSYIYIFLKIYTANSIKVDIDNSQMCIMIDRVPKE